jgi:hypothetical protein
VWPTNGAPVYPGTSLPDSSATSSCSAIASSDGAQPAGGDALLLSLSLTPGGIGYADLATLEQFEDALQPWTASVLIRASESATLPGTYVNAASIRSANCDFSALSLPEGGASTGMVGLDVPTSSDPSLPPDTWAVDNSTNHENATDQGSWYPICGLTFELVYSGLSTSPPGTPGGGPSAIVDLTNDQRRTLYSHMLFILRSDAQNLLSSNYYAPLPAPWLSAIVAGFEANY